MKTPLLTILVADDDPISSRILERKLQSWGYDTLHAGTGGEALKALSRPNIRLALLDWMMPEADGPEICRRIREQKKAPYTYIILLTSRDQPQDIIAGLQAGADDYMTKPVNFLELKARLQTGHRIIALEDRLLRTQERLTELATRDTLTKLWNRRMILRFLEEELARAGRSGDPVGCVMIDIDNFKNINDTHGHQKGDKTLQYVAETLAKGLRSYDKIGRYGGDELMVVLPQCGRDDLVKIAERMRLACAAESIVADGIEIAVTVSLGCALSESLSRRNADDLIVASDQALYRSKASGRNRVTLFPIEK